LQHLLTFIFQKFQHGLATNAPAMQRMGQEIMRSLSLLRMHCYSYYDNFFCPSARLQIFEDLVPLTDTSEHLCQLPRTVMQTAKDYELIRSWRSRHIRELRAPAA